MFGLVLGLLGLVGCSGSSTTPVVGSSSTSTGTSATTVVGAGGPVVNKDHWHAAYGVFDCDKYIAPIDGSELPDPDGIHTHADGLIHIHPFTERAAGANAVLGRFFDVMGIKVTPSSLTIASLAPLLARNNGDKCPDGKTGRVRVIEFVGPTKSQPKELTDPASLRLQKDQVISIVFAADDQLIGPPPSVSELDAPSDAPITFELTPDRLKLVGPAPTFEKPTGEKPDQLVIEDLELGTGDTAGENSKVGIKFLLGTWSGERFVEGNWNDSAALMGLALGRNAVVKGFEQGVVGMRVGGLRRIIIPPSLGFGTFGSPPVIGPNETLVLYVRLVAVEAPRFNYTGTTVAS